MAGAAFVRFFFSLVIKRPLAIAEIILSLGLGAVLIIYFTTFWE